ncbi:CBPM Carboxypeptidase, partial [Dromaius novaehollandiae]|nr:CBPM Carboxypeptidase [Dromaius novaehollandiae]
AAPRSQDVVGALCLVCLAAALDFRYHHAEELEAFLQEVHAAFPALTHLHSIGRSVEGRDLWVLVLGRFPTHHKIGIPEFKYVANMHGDETVGREVLLHLIDFLVTNYGRDPVVTRLLNSTRIHIMPTMNPDGFEATEEPDCYYSHGRYNKNGEDLNRNFPDAFENNNVTIQPETRAVMNWIKNETFVLSANLHGGALVASYTFDNGNAVTGSSEGYSKSPDDDVFIHLAKTYSYNHASMYKGTGCDNRQTFPEGITNGYSWYQLEGGMQDYNYVWGQCFEITLELSCCKYPPADQLEEFWRDNKVALIEYIKQVHLGGYANREGSWSCRQAGGQSGDSSRSQVQCQTSQARSSDSATSDINATVPGFKSMLKTVEVSSNSDNFSALKCDFCFSEVSIKTRASSCPKIPLYQELERASAAGKPTLNIFVLMTVMLVILK